MKLRSLKISGFRSFEAQSTLVFPDGGGFYLLSGENKREPELGANATGKSTVWDALCWVFFGKTPRRLKGPVLSNWQGTNQTTVAVTFEVGGYEYTLQRAWSPNGLFWVTDEDNHECAQEEVEELIGFNFDTFRSCVLMCQFDRFFFDLSPTEKLNLFSSVLGLDYWVEASRKASSRVKELDEEICKREQRIARLRGRIDHARETLTKSRGELTTLKKELAAVERKAKADLKKEQTKLAEAEFELDDSRVKSQTLEDELHDARIAQSKSAKSLMSYQEKLHRLDKKIDLANQASATFAKAIIELENSNNVCPTCNGRMDPIVVRTKVNEHRRGEEQADTEAAVHAKQYGIIKRKEASAQRRVDMRAAAVETLEQGARFSLEKVTTAKGKVAGIRARIETIEVSVSDARDEIELAKKVATDMRAEITEMKEAVAKKKRILLKRKSEMNAVSYWPGGFKDVRLWLIEQALVELQLETNACLVELGLSDWNVQYDIERETKTGNVSRGFTVSIKPPHTGSLVPWEAWSGGETQRLRIAGSVALSNLIAARVGELPSIEVWDEPTQHLSEQGIEDLLSFFRDRAHRSKRQVWLVDHRSLDSGLFTREFRVEKDKQGSKIRELVG